MDTIRKYGLLFGCFFLINQEMADLSAQPNALPKVDYMDAVEFIVRDYSVFNSRVSGVSNEKLPLFPHTRFFLNKQ
ncbi:MAG: hypothetical protein JJU34_04580 [Lunatimonas sp.]|nr:hypothetical protein [Lunatimonas sp.]